MEPSISWKPGFYELFPFFQKLVASSYVSFPSWKLICSSLLQVSKKRLYFRAKYLFVHPHCFPILEQFSLKHNAMFIILKIILSHN